MKTRADEFSGLTVAMITPFKENLDLDLDRTEELADRLVKGGTDSIIVCGTTGENATLTHDEHLELVRTAVQSCAGRMKVIVGVGSNNTLTALRNAENARAAGADARAMRFAEGEVLVPAMLHEGELRAMLAVDQQALASIALMRENDRELIRCVRQVAWAVRHALDVSELIDRMGDEAARCEMEEAAGQLDEALGAAAGVIPG